VSSDVFVIDMFNETVSVSDQPELGLVIEVDNVVNSKVFPVTLIEVGKEILKVLELLVVIGIE
jgi:hypothetical protein